MWAVSKTLLSKFLIRFAFLKIILLHLELAFQFYFRLMILPSLVIGKIGSYFCTIFRFCFVKVSQNLLKPLLANNNNADAYLLLMDTRKSKMINAKVELEPIWNCYNNNCYSFFDCNLSSFAPPESWCQKGQVCILFILNPNLSAIPTGITIKEVILWLFFELSLYSTPFMVANGLSADCTGLF